MLFWGKRLSFLDTKYYLLLRKVFPLEKGLRLCLAIIKEIPISFTIRFFLPAILDKIDVNLLLLQKVKHQIDGFYVKTV